MQESFMYRVFIQLLNGLREVHTHKILHLDIKPSNIYIRADGSPVLIDFGAARHALSQDFMSSQMYTPGFAAPEQYEQRDRLGPWTDIYSVGAAMFACITKSPPPPADVRMEKDKLPLPLTKTHQGIYSKGMLELIDSMLILNYAERPQSVFWVQKQLINMAQVTHLNLNKPTLFALIKKKLTRA
jgi:serine/threonine protein kinase